MRRSVAHTREARHDECHDEEASRPREPFRVKPHDFGVNPTIDLDRMNQLVDELEASHFALGAPASCRQSNQTKEEGV